MTQTTFQTRGEQFRPSWLNEHTKKQNAEYGDELNKPIKFLPLLLTEAITNHSLFAAKKEILSSLESIAAELKEELGVSKAEDVSDEDDGALQKILVQIEDEDKEYLFTEQVDADEEDGQISSC